MRVLVLLFFFIQIFTPVWSYDGKSLPIPKAIPGGKALPKTKALPSTKPLPSFKAVPKSKKLQPSKPLPKVKTLVLKPVFEPEFLEKDFEGSDGPTFKPKSGVGPETRRKSGPDPRFDQPSEVQKFERNKIQWQEGVMNLTLDTVSYGDIRIFTTDKFEPLFIKKTTWIDQLETNLMPEIFQQIKLYFRDKRWVEKEELTTMGFGVEVDESNLIVDISVPANYRKIRTKQLGGNILQGKAIDIRPAKRSASITPYWSRTWRNKISETNFVSLDAALNFDGWVLESDTTYNLIDSKHTRKTTRVVHDYPEQVARLSFGDIEYKTVGLMGRMPLGGISLNREFSLSPNLLTSPISHQKIFLENDSIVRIIVNNIPRQSFSLRAGYYDLQDFPLIDGLNFVTIEITDIYGQVTTHEYLGFDNKKILVPGITDYSISTGFERITDEVVSTTYDMAEPAYSGYLRHGVHKNITLGVLSEGASNFLSGGGYAAATHLLGTLELTGLVSQDVDGSDRKGYGASANYFFSTQRFTFSNTAYVKSLNFSYLGKNEYSQAQKYFYSGTIGMPLPFLHTWRQNFSGRYERRWNGSEEARASAKITGSVSKNFKFSADLFYSMVDDRSNTDKGVVLTLRFQPAKRISVTAIYDAENEGQQLDIVRGIAGEQGVGLNASVANNEFRSRLNGGITWKAQYFDARASYNVEQDPIHKFLDLEKLGLQNDRQEFTTASLTSSFAYVDGVIAMGPPIRNGSFAIFKSGEGLGRGRIAVAKSSDEDDRDAMPFLKGSNSVVLFTDLNQYGESSAHLLPYLEDGFIGLDKRQYRIFSRYRSGSLINVTKDIKLYGTGVLANKEWQPIPLTRGTFINQDSKAKTRFFTDEEGYFEVENLRLGQYRIVLDGGRGSGTVEVKQQLNKPTTDSYIDFGILNLEGVN